MIKNETLLFIERVKLQLTDGLSFLLNDGVSRVRRCHGRLFLTVHDASTT